MGQPHRLVFVLLAACIALTVVSAAIPKPTWVEPMPDAEQNSYDFHIQVQDWSNKTGTDVEIHDGVTDETVWYTSVGDIFPHVHNGDGTFVGSLAGHDRLIPGHPYTIRARFRQNATLGPWNGSSFTTEPDVIYSNSPLNWTPMDGYVVEKYAENLSFPVALRTAPDSYGSGPDAPRFYVAELYGTIKVVTRSGETRTFANNLLNYQPFDSFPGAGEAGVTGLWVDTDGTVWATMTYTDNGKLYGKLERFDPSADGLTAVNRTDVFTGIPCAPSHQIQMVTRGPDGKLYINTGDANNLTATKDWHALTGKILRINDDGSIPADNPDPTSPVWVAGLRNPFGADWYDGSLWITQNGPDRNDGIYQLNGSETLGWYPDMTKGAFHNWFNTVAPVQIQVDHGTSGFPTKGAVYVALSGPTYSYGPAYNSKRIERFVHEPDGHNHIEDVVTYTGSGLSAPIGLEFGSDGLYFTDLYGEAGIDAHGVSSGAIYRIRYVGNVSLTDPVDFHMNEWFPQGLAVSLSCHANGTGSYRYVYDFGNGYSETIYKGDFVYHVYDQPGTYTARCIATDLVTGAKRVESLTYTLANGTSTGGGTTNDTNTSTGNQTNTTNLTGSLGVSLEMAQWFPQGLAASLECHSNSSDATYAYDFGNGYTETISTDSFVYHVYDAAGTYNASCTVTDLPSGASETANLTVTVGSSSSGGGSGTGGGTNGTGGGSGGNGGSGGSGNATNTTNSSGNVTVSFAMGQWFPQGLAVALECGSNRTNAVYAYDFGNGYSETIDENSFVYHVMDAPGTYTATCTVTDLDTGDVGSSQLVYTVN